MASIHLSINVALHLVLDRVAWIALRGREGENAARHPAEHEQESEPSHRRLMSGRADVREARAERVIGRVRLWYRSSSRISRLA